jgi:xanthine dehydrogenase YagR molybdenum-binding subunit
MQVDLGQIVENRPAGPDPQPAKKEICQLYALCRAFAEVRVDEELGVFRVTRVVCATAADRILNPKAARSMIPGDVVAIGPELPREIRISEHRRGRGLFKKFAKNCAQYWPFQKLNQYGTEGPRREWEPP